MISSTARVKSRTQAIEVAGAIRRRITERAVEPGARLIEQELAEEFACSRHVIREAFGLLELQGLVINHPFRGRSVVSFTPAQIRELIIMRISLEATMAALAAYKATPEQCRWLLHLADEMENCRSLCEVIEQDAELHRAIWAIADMPIIAAQLEHVLLPLMMLNRLPRPSGETLQPISDDQVQRERTGHPGGHRPLLEAICSQDATAARTAMIKHLFGRGVAHLSRELAAAVHAALPEIEG